MTAFANNFWHSLAGNVPTVVTTAVPPNTVYYVTVDVAANSGGYTAGSNIQYPTQTNWPWSSAVSGQLGSQTASGFEAQRQQMFYNMMMQQGYGYRYMPPISSLMDYEETAEQRAERLKKYAEREAKRKAAEQRAEHLLFTILTPSQVKQYKDDSYFEQPVGSRIYRIRKGRSRNVELIEGGKVTALYCAHPHNAYDTPVPDVMLSQMLMLKASEAEFLKIANRTVVQ